MRQYIVDAFANRPFAGNPAAVCPLSAWPDEALLQAIAAENNLSETAYFVAEGEGYRLRWFTPLCEVDLCGHATLAAAHVLFAELGYADAAVRFFTRSGELVVERCGALLRMDFPARPARACPAPTALAAALGQTPLDVLAADDWLVLLASEAQVRELNPDMALLKQLPLRGVIVTAAGESNDFVSRFFAPKFGIPEDPVTGSAHCTLAPYWGERLGKSTLHARQISARGGEVVCELQGERVLLSGAAVTVLTGEWR